MFEKTKNFKKNITLMAVASLLMMPSMGLAKTVEKDPDFDKKVTSLRIPFIENHGQVGDKHVRYYAKTFGGTLFVTQEGDIVYSLPLIEKESRDHLKTMNEKDDISQGWSLKERLQGSLSVTPIGLDPAQTKVNYFTGNDPSKWKSNLPTYNEIHLGEVYEGIDLKLRAYGNNAEKIFTVHPGSCPDTIHLSMEGALSLSINHEGRLVAETGLGPVQFTAPIAYQLKQTSNRRDYVQVAYRLTNNGYGFEVENYDKQRPLIIDPLLASTFIGGSISENAYDIALDASGNVYIAGETSSSFYPMYPYTGYDTGFNGGTDVFISRMDANLTTLQASTFIGGSSNDGCNSLDIDSAEGTIFITGYTASGTTPYPATAGVWDNTHNGGEDVFVSAFNPDLTLLVASTFIGGTVDDRGYSIAVDGSGNIYITGYTNYTAVAGNYPTTGGVYDEVHNQGYDVFVSRLNATLTSLEASTFIGGGDNDFGYALTLDSSSNVYIAGRTTSSSAVTGYPVTAPPGVPFQGSYQGGNNDAFVTRLNSDLTAANFVSTFLGGSENDQAWSIALDGSNNVYVTGYTYSDDFPTTTGSPLAGTYDVFITRLDQNLTSLSTGRFIGAEVGAQGYAIAVDTSGNTIYITGNTSSSGTTPFPVTSGAYPPQGGNDAFLTLLDSSLAIIASTCLGGLEGDGGNALVVDSSGNIYLTGYTASFNFPITYGGYQQELDGNSDVFITRLTPDLTFMSPGDYYVDISQASEGDGSSGDPWRTLHYALREINNGSAGDYTLHVAAGNYSILSPSSEEDSPLNVGRAGSNIQILGDSTGNSVMVGADDSNWHDAFSIYTSGVTIENMSITGFDKGVYIKDASPDIRKNWIYDCDEGIYVYAYQEDIAPTIWNNLIYNTAENMFYGISLVGSGYGSESITSSTTIYHNTIHGVVTNGIFLWEPMGGYGSTVEPDIRYNIVTNCMNYGIEFVVDDGTPGAPIFQYNNVYDNTTGNYGGELTDQTGSNGNISEDPDYVNSALYNFHLNTGSPCIDAIPPAAGDPVTEDLQGYARPANTDWDMGAYEYDAATPSQYTLTVSVTPEGGGTVTGTGISCPGDCTQDYNESTLVSMTAAPASGYEFLYWTGDVSDTSANISFMMDSDINITANFAAETYTLTVNTTGSGTVTLDPPGGVYALGSGVTLTAVPDSADCHFMEWSGDLTGTTNPDTITITSDMSVTATFNCEAQTPANDDTNGPANNEQVGEVSGVTLAGSAFSDPDVGDTHTLSHWLVRWAGSIYHRADYPASFDTVVSPPADLTMHSIDGLESGIKYVWKVGYVDSGSGVTSWSPEYSFIVGTSSVTGVVVGSGTEIDDYSMISFTQFPDQSAVTQTITLGRDSDNVRFGTWDPDNGGYISWGNNLFLEPGRAYWVLARNGMGFDLSGVTVSTSHDMEIPLGYNPITGSAWNMIAPPNNACYLWDNVEVVRYNPDTGAVLFGPTPISDPSVATYIDRHIWQWDSGSYVEHHPGDGFILEPGEGYWVLSLLPNVYLRFPVAAQEVASLSGTPATMFARMYEQGKEWIRKGLFSPRTATAEDDVSPPMPMADFSEPLTSDAPGCFVGATGISIKE